jgi:predicted Zn-dependent peptidase
MATPKPEVYRLKNGMRIIHQRLPYSRMVHCGVLVNAGSRHENPEENGVAHLLEHAVFKGTKRRKPFHILSRMENVGGELDAFTSRDRTAYTASAPKRYAERAVELLTDMLFNPTFPQEEISKERQVIQEELETYQDNPEESLIDEFHAYHYADHPLGYNILGKIEALRSLDSDNLHNFHQKYYQPDNMVLALVGNISATRASRLIQYYFEPLSSRDKPQAEEARSVEVSKPFQKTLPKDFQQTYCILGAPVYGRNSEHHYTMHALNALLGGSDMSARLNLRLREQYGYVYQVDTAYIPYADAGLFTIDFSTDWQHYEQCAQLIQKELKQIGQQAPGKIQLNRAKRQLLGQASMQEENPVSLMMALEFWLMNYDKVYSYHDFAQQVNQVSAGELSNLADAYLAPENFSWLTYKSSGN